MQRRDFLKLMGLTSVAISLPVPGWVSAVSAARSEPTSYEGALYRPGGNGRIELSDDAGATWRLHSDLGSDYLVKRLTVDRRKALNANIGFGDWTFGLTLAPDRRSWLTT